VQLMIIIYGNLTNFSEMLQAFIHCFFFTLYQYRKCWHTEEGYFILLTKVTVHIIVICMLCYYGYPR
jgi:hypothetical protein